MSKMGFVRSMLTLDLEILNVQTELGLFSTQFGVRGGEREREISAVIITEVVNMVSAVDTFKRFSQPVT
jgi:hypothetical protein